MCWIYNPRQLMKVRMWYDIGQAAKFSVRHQEQWMLSVCANLWELKKYRLNYVCHKLKGNH